MSYRGACKFSRNIDSTFPDKSLQQIYSNGYPVFVNNTYDATLRDKSRNNINRGILNVIEGLESFQET